MVSSDGITRSAWLETVSYLVLIATCGVVLWSVLAPSSSGRPASPAPPLPAKPQALSGVHVEGNETANVGIIEYSDFQCPFCIKFTRDVLPSIRENYVKSGKVLFAFRHFPLEKIHPFAVGAASGAECAGEQQQFWSFHDGIFAAPALGAETDRAVALGLRLDMDAWIDCLSSKSTAQRIQSDIADGKDVGVRGTPFFIIGSVRDGTLKAQSVFAGARQFSEFRAILDKLLAAGSPPRQVDSR